jgi:carboxylesterase
MEPMGAYLSSEDISCKGITLPGHGTSPEEFSRTTNQKLLAMVETEYLKLKEKCDSVILVGFSMGGLLALQLSTLRNVDGIVAICTPMFLCGGRAGETVIGFASKLGGAFGASLPKMGLMSLSDKTLSEYLTGYEKYPLRSISRLVNLMEVTRPVLRRVSAPILVMQSRKDNLIWKKSGEYLFDSVGSAKKKIVQMVNSRHKAPIDIDRHFLFEEIRRFSVECAAK